MEKMIEIVNQCLRDYVGGTAFFDALDNAVKYDSEILAELMNKVNGITRMKFKTIATGEFGLCLHNYGYHVDILVPGGLRKSHTIPDLSGFIRKNEWYLILDDSYFSGTTVAVIEQEIIKCGGHPFGAYVIYDGSKQWEQGVRSLYRYYDHYDLLGNEITTKPHYFDGY